MKARGTLARLEALEVAEQARVAADVAVKEEQTRRAMARLPHADRAALYEHLKAQEAGGPWWEEVVAAGDALSGPPLEDRVGEAARAWWEALGDIPDGVPYPMPPAGAAVYFEREAVRCEAERLRLAGQTWPDGLTLEALDTAALWSAVWWRYEASYALELAEA